MDKSGAKVLLDTTVTPDFIKDGGYDAVILAVGSSPARPPIPGLDDPSVEHATTVYTKLDQVGKRVAVLGGGLVGCETGLFLAERGHQVTIIEMQSEIAPEANWMHKEGMMQAFAKAPITARTGPAGVPAGAGQRGVRRQRRGRRGIHPCGHHRVRHGHAPQHPDRGSTAGRLPGHRVRGRLRPGPEGPSGHGGGCSDCP